MVSRDELYELVWTGPMTALADRFEVTGGYLARVCDALNVPRPKPGYWQKLAVGRASPRPELPAPRPGDQLQWEKGEEIASAPRRPKVTQISRRSSRERAVTNQIHALIREAKIFFDKGRPVEDQAYLSPYKRLMVDITVSAACLGKGLDFANALFKACEASGHRIDLAPSGDDLRRATLDERELKGRLRDAHRQLRMFVPARPTIVYIGSVPIGLAVLEMSENVLLRYVAGKYIRDTEYVPSRHYPHDHTFTTRREIPSGRLRLIAYSPYALVDWSMDWQETATAELTSSISTIVRSLERAAPKLVKMLETARQEAEIARQEREIEYQRWLRADDLRRIEQSRKESKDQLLEVIRRWSDVVGVERFLAEADARVADLADARGDELRTRLALARELLGSQDPTAFLSSWRSPAERYQPKFDHDVTAVDDVSSRGKSNT